MSDQANLDNRVRWQQASPRGHVESFFLKANDPTRPRAVWLKWTIFVPEGHPEEALSELWAVYFDRASASRVAVKQVCAASDSTLSRDGFEVSVAGSQLGPGLTAGACSSGGRSVAWDLGFSCQAPSLHLLPHGMLYGAPWPRSKLLTPYPDARFDGDLEIDGERLRVEGWRGMQGHNWGREHTHHYAWGHCNVFDEGEAVFEGVSGSLRLGPVMTPFMSLFFLSYDGQDLRFNQLQRALSHRVRVEGLRWHFVAENEQWQLEGEMQAQRDETVGLFYENPDRAMTHCLNSKLARAQLWLRGKTASGWREHARLRSSHSAAFEVATRDPCHGVQMFV